MTNNVFEFPNGSRGPARRLIPSQLRDARIAKQFNQSDLAAAVGVTRQAISAFEQGDKAPEAATMDRIADILEQPLPYFTTEDNPTFGTTGAKFFRRFGPETKRRNSMCDVLGKWFVQIARYLDNFVNYPTLELPSASPANAASRYTQEEIELIAEECRRMWGLGVGPISNVIALLESKGITICRYEIPEEQIDAFSFWNGAKAFIFLSSDKESAVRARFDAVHELGHLILHRWVDPEELENKNILKAVEAEANRFAGAFLLPRRSFPNEVYTTRLDSFLGLKRRWKVAIQAMVYRCKDLGLFDDDQITNLYKQISARKWRTREPLDDELPIEQPRLLGRAVGLVLDAGRKAADEICLDLRVSRLVIERMCNLPAGALAVANVAEIHPTLK